MKTSIKEKLRFLQEEKKSLYTDTTMKDIFGENFKQYLINQPDKPYHLLPFKEDDTIYVCLVIVYKEPSSDEVTKYAFNVSFNSGYFYKEVDDSTLYLLKTYRSFHQEQLKALDMVFSDKKHRLKGLL